MKRPDPAARHQEAIYAALARLGGALGSAHRLRMVSLLSQGTKTVEELAALTGQSLAAASAHLKVLRAAGLVVSRKEGRHVHCRLAGEDVARLWLSLRDLGEELVPAIREAIHEGYGAPEELSPLGMPEVRDWTRRRRGVLLDLRPEPEYREGHLPGARNLPFTELGEGLPRLPRRRPLLVYCRGPYCLAALQGVRTLRGEGYPAKRLPYGVPEWRAAGLPVER